MKTFFKSINDHRGTLWITEQIPFDIKRIFFVNDLMYPRGNHAHKKLSEFLLVTRGSLVVQLENQRKDLSSVRVNQGEGLLLPPNIWRTVHHLEQPCDYMCLCSDIYDQDDYIFTKDEFYFYQYS